MYVQYLSAATGIFHTEHNSVDKTSRFLQIGLLPDKKGLTPDYGDHRFKWEDRETDFQVTSGRQACLVQIEGRSKINTTLNHYCFDASILFRLRVVSLSQRRLR